MSTADEIKKLKELLDEGVLSEEEFNSEKNKLLASKSSKTEKEKKLEESLTSN